MEIYDYKKRSNAPRTNIYFKDGDFMLVKSDAKKEEKIIEELVSSDKSLREQHELFEAEMAFKQELIEARRSRNLTQNDVSSLTGLSQQAVSRLENGSGGTLSTIMRYLNSVGYSLTIKKVEP